jgi:hypothetical protein
VANSCAACLLAFNVDEKLSWSSNPECKHVIHLECIHDWLDANGRKHMKKVQRSRELEHQSREHLVEQVTNFPMFCPCFRQVFVVHNNNSSDDKQIEEDIDSGVSDMEETGNDVETAPAR